MENKTILEGVILNQPKLTDFGSTLLRIKNTKTYKKKDGSPGESTYTAVVSVEWRKLAEEVVNRFKQNDLVRVEGELKKKKTDKVDQDGTEIWETWIKALTINYLPNGGSMTNHEALQPKPSGPVYGTKPLEDRMGYPPKAVLPDQAPYQAVKQPTPIFKKNPNASFAGQPEPIPLEDPNAVFEEYDLPF